MTNNWRKTMEMEEQELLKKREYTRKYREKHLDKDKKFFSVRFSKEEGEEIKKFMEKHNISIKEIIENGTEIMWKEIK